MRVRTVALLATLILIAAACGDDDGESSASDSASDEASEEPAPEPEEEPTPEPEPSDPTYQDVDATLQAGVDQVCNFAAGWEPGDGTGDIIPLTLQTGGAGPVLEEYGTRIQEADESDLPAVMADLADACTAFGWPGA